MQTRFFGGMFPRVAVVVALLSLVITTHAAEPSKETIVDLGDRTYSITHESHSVFTKSSTLKAEVKEAAEAYCAKLGRKLRVLNIKFHRPTMFVTGGFARATITFEAVAPRRPEEAPALPSPKPAPVKVEKKSEVDALYSDLMKLDELRKKGLLTDAEFQAEKKKLLDRTNDKTAEPETNEAEPTPEG